MSRSVTTLVALASSLLVAEPALHDNRAALIWNASASLPIGLYRLALTPPIEVGDIVVVRPPEPLAGFLTARGYLPRGVPLMKRVQATAGAVVCRVALTIIVNGHVIGTATTVTARALPVLTDDGGDGHFHWHVGDRSGTP
jgi:type IV secretory pathway protease TraF